MHYTTLSAATILAMASSVYADNSGVALASVVTHNGCGTGEYPFKAAAEETSNKAAITPDTCTKVKVTHELGVTSYSVGAELIGKSNCYGVGVYTNEECVGAAESVSWFDSDNNRAQSVCFPKRAFGKYVAIKLLCNDPEPEQIIVAPEHEDDDDDDEEERTVEEPVKEEKPAEKPAEEEKPKEEEKPAEKTEEKPAEKPAEEQKPAEEEKPKEEEKPAEEEKPKDEEKPAEEKPEDKKDEDTKKKPLDGMISFLRKLGL